MKGSPAQKNTNFGVDDICHFGLRITQALPSCVRYLQKMTSKLKWMLLFISGLAMPAMAQYQVNGAAVQLSCNCYRLTQAINTQSGSVWNVNQISLNNPFDFTFNVYLGNNDGGADGIAFMMQPISTSIGSTGGGLGYEGISPSLAIEIDTYQNGWDPTFDHIAIMANGVVDHGSVNNLAGPLSALQSGGNIEDGQEHLLRVVWNPSTNTLTTYVDGALRVQSQGDYINTIFGGNPMVYWGFTASTGGLNNEHRFCLAMLPDATLSANAVCLGTPINIQDNSYSALGSVVGVTWNLGNGQTINAINPGDVTYAQPGTYNVIQTITDAAGCTAVDTFQLTVHPNPNVSISATEVCLGNTTQLDETSSVQPGFITAYTWNHGDGTSSSAQDHGVIYTSPGTYDVSITITSNNNCTATATTTATVNPQPEATASLSSVFLNGLFSTTPGLGSTAQWFVLDTVLTGAEVAYTFPDSGYYQVRLVVTNQFGCTDTLIQQIHIEGQPQIITPSVFTPNGDNTNDRWEPFTYGYTAANVRIYSRWGRKVYDFDGPIAPGTIWGWDGKINGGGDAAQGTYYFLIAFTSLDNTVVRQHGYLTLLR